MKRLDMDVREEPCIPIKDFRIAFPKLYKEILEEGRLLGYAQAVEKERLARMGTTGGTKPTTVSPDMEESKETKKKRLIQEYRKGNPEASLKEATLAVGKAHSELFR